MPFKQSLPATRLPMHDPTRGEKITDILHHAYQGEHVQRSRLKGAPLS
jgi:hypothetical protein